MIAVLTDSTCDLPPAALRDLGIHMLPLGVQLGGRRLRDWTEIQPAQVFQSLEREVRVSTAPIDDSTFRQRYQTLLDHYDGVVSIHISSGISQTVQHARQAVQALSAADRIQVIDSRVSSVLLASAVLAAQKRATRGGTLDEVTQAAHRTLDTQYGEFTVPTLEYLRRGGRINPVQYAVGNLLGVRPVVAFEAGQLKALRRVKPEQAAQDILQTLSERFGWQPVSVAVGLAGHNPQHLARLREQMKRSGLNIRAGRTQQIGAVIGAHTGPGMFAFVAEPFEG